MPAWVVERLETEWKVLAVHSRGGFFHELLDAEAPRFILKPAAAVCSKYYRNNPEALSPDIVRLMNPYLSLQDWELLQSLLPATDPGPNPPTLAEVCDWFVQQYLPYRARNRNRTEYSDRICVLAREFGLWCLRFYARAIAGGPGGSLLSWSRTAELENNSSSVNLLVVLDGLGFTDAKQVTQYITDEIPRLSMDRLEIVLSPLPTITYFAKPALTRGVSPAQAFEDAEIGVIKTRDGDVATALDRAHAGTLIIWSLLEPDKTYHTRLEEQALRSEVSGRLLSITQRLARIIEKVSDRQKLRVILTTDHGRLLSTSQRACQVPAGMVAHGRAAWGEASVPFDREGIYVDGDVAYLNAERFALPDGKHAAVIMSDAAFLMSDGRSGVESFPHGGVFPEEVLIPWAEFTRDRGPLRISFNISGSGMAGALGHVRLNVINTSEIQVEVVQLVIPALGAPFSISLKVAPFKDGDVQLPVAKWPAAKELHDIEAVVTYVLPTGDRQTARTVASLTAEEMYKRDTTLDDLL
jgi:hypothetical protein